MSEISSSSSTSSDDEEVIAFVQRLNRLRKPRIYRNRADNFAQWDENEFYSRFRLSKRAVNIILLKITPKIKSKTDWNHCVTPGQKLLLTLRFMATNNFLISVGDFVGIHKSTTGKYIWQVLQAIAILKAEHLYMPRNAQEISNNKIKFYELARFPNVIGALDCTHVKIESSGGNQAENFRNRKGFFSFNVQAICNAQLKFINIVARWPGSVHDSRIFNNSLIKQRFQSGEFGNSLLVADSGYGITNYCVTPIQEPRTDRENLYNEAHIRTRNVIERAFGVLKRRFPVLSLGIRLDVMKVQYICVVAAILHNIAIDLNEPEPAPLPDNIEHAIRDVNNVPIERHENNNNNAVLILNLLEYFENLR